MKIPFDFDQMEYFEFMWLFERLVKEKNKESESINTNRNLRPGQVNLANELMQERGI
jgi:hypothetical protein